MSTPKKMIATDKQNGKSMTKSRKNESIKRYSFVGVGIISIIFHCFELVVLIVDGLFFGVVSVDNVRCLQDVIYFIVDIKNQEKTPTRQPSSQEEGPPYGYPEESRTKIGGVLY
jgi:hypothetical protein